MKIKIAAFLVILLLYPLFLQSVHITDLRAIPLIVPYCLAALSVIVILSEIIEAFRKKKDS